MNVLDVIAVTIVLGTVAAVGWTSGYLWGRWHTLLTRVSLDPGLTAAPSPTPTVVLAPEVDVTRGPLAGHVYRIMPDPAAQELGHREGLVVWFDDARQILNDQQVAAYADGRADQAGDDDPEASDAAVGCTDIDATWCPVCGRCSCDVDPAAPGDEAHRALDPDCQLHGIYSDHAGQDPLVDDDPEPDPEPVEDDNLRECWSCTADRPATNDPCLYCQTPASRWTRGEQVTGHRYQLPGRHGQVGVVERVGHAPNGQPFYHVRWPDTSGRGTLADRPYGQRELADPDHQE